MIKRFSNSAFVLIVFIMLATAAPQSSGKLKGRIENEKGKPIAGADVRAMRSRDRSVKETKTDQEGNFSFDLPPMTTP